VGYEFISSYQDDHTDFDETEVGQIEKSKTTRSQVTALMGRSGGMYAYPLIKSKSDRALVYCDLRTRSAPMSVKIYQKRLVVAFNGADTVTDVEFSTSGKQ
jgi:hypothetical protein